MSLRQKNPLVAIVGATGTQGGATASALLKCGYQVRALTRYPKSAAAHKLQQAGAEICAANLTDPTSLKHALVGVDAMFAVTTPFGTSVEAEVAQGKALVDAARASHVSHIVFTSAANANLHTGIPHFESKYAIEQYLKSSGLTWTIIGPAAFMDDFAHGWYKRSLDEGRLTMVMSPDQPLLFVCSQDIGAMAALAINQRDRFAGKRIDIAGDNISGAEIAMLFSNKLGRHISYEEVPLKVAEGYLSDLAAMFGYFQKTGLSIDLEHLRSVYPEVRWHTFADWLDLEE